MSSSSLELPDCPDENALAAYVEGSLAEPHVAAIAEHLDACAPCLHVAASVAHALGVEATLDARPEASEDDDVRAVSRLQDDQRARILPGQSLGRYVVGEMLGAGGMGAVYVARDPDLDREVALKVVSPRGDDAAERRLRLLREARSAAKLQHPNVVAVYDVGEVGESAYLAMELVRGSSLRQLVGDASVPLARRLGWLGDVARALAAAHAQGLVHRDIKPENVMVRDDGVVKVVDFGIARTHAGRTDAAGPGVSRITKTGAIIGTPAYMAPEQLRDEAIDPRTDQFAWGVVAYELFSGTLPWRGDGLPLVAEILTADPARLRVSGGDGSVDAAARLDTIVRRAMAKTPAERFASMQEIVDALSHDGEPAAAKAPARSRASVPVLGALVVALAVALAVFATRKKEEATPSTTASPSTGAAATAAPPPASEATATSSTVSPVSSVSRPTLPARGRGQAIVGVPSARASASAAAHPSSSARVDMLDLRK